jgi:hypothetical protein
MAYTIDEVVEFGEYTGSGDGEQWPVIPDETYYARLIKRETVEKPQRKIDSELEAKRKKQPDLTAEDIDPYQWKFTYRISRGDQEGFELPYYCNRTTTWHEMATATKMVAAVAGLDKYDRAALVEKYGTLDGMIAMQPECRIEVALYEGKDKKWRNGINTVLPLPKGVPAHLLNKGKGNGKPPAQRPTVPQVSVPELADGDEPDLWES